MNCSRSGCIDKAIFQIGIKLYAVGWGKIKDPAIGKMGVYLCHEHRYFATKENLITDAGWENILSGFKLKGVCPPDRNLAEIELIEL